MDYETAYKKAIKRMETFYKDDFGCIHVKPEEIFPELKESEDERIRKVLLRCCYDWDSGRSSCVAIGDVPAIRAYLEKQKEQKYTNSEKPKEWSEEDEKIYKVVLELLNSWSNGTIGCCIIPPNTDRYINWLKSFPERFNLPPKQEWSEEDKVMLNNIIWGVHMKSIKPLDEMEDRSKYEKYEDFLKALPERFNLQPKQEWSEEDEKNLNWLIEQFDFLQPHKEGFYVLKVRPWLVSLPTRFNP